jgi:hypothetical protein
MTTPRYLNNAVMQLKKICNHPFIFEGVDNGMMDHLGINREYEWASEPPAWLWYSWRFAVRASATSHFTTSVLWPSLLKHESDTVAAVGATPLQPTKAPAIVSSVAS